MREHLLTLASLALGAAVSLASAARATEPPVTAIDILLDPDATMVAAAEAANADLRGNYPKGFSLDASHRPHITVVQSYVRTADLDKVYAAAGKVLETEAYRGWKLTAFKYYYLPLGDIGLAGIVARPTSELMALQRALIAAVAPYAVKTGTAEAFVTTPADPEINQPTMDYVAAFASEASGDRYNPHVTTGIGTRVYLDALLAKPFSEFTFFPASASVYQLGNFGTASRLLKTLSPGLPAPPH